MVPLKIVHGGSLRPDTQTVYGDNFTAVCQIHNGRRYAEEIALVGMHNVQGQTDGHTSVDGIATTSQNIESSHGSSRMAGDDNTVRALDERAQAR
jgi:hypothetical protein